MSTSYLPNLTARVHMALANAGATPMSTAEIADRAGVPVGDGGFARGLVWRELDMLVRHGEVERIKRPESRFVHWRRAGAVPARSSQCPHTPACPPADAANCFEARMVADHPEQNWALLCNGVVIVDHEPLTGAKPTLPWATYRVQRRRTAGWRMPADTVYVGRPTKFGNPFPVAEHGQAAAVERFRLWLQTQPLLVDQARRELRGKHLACWCRLDQPCHADVLLQAARSTGPSAPGASR
jgi:hypothetical protein